MFRYKYTTYFSKYNTSSKKNKIFNTNCKNKIYYYRNILYINNSVHNFATKGLTYANSQRLCTRPQT